MARWLETFPVPEESPAHYVRDIRFSTGVYDDVPEKFFEHIPWFTNVERVTFLEDRTFRTLWVAPFWRLPQSATSLTIGPHMSTGLVQIRDIMAQLPNLDDLSMSGSLFADRRTLLGIGTVLKGRFGGHLQLLRGCACGDILGMLLEIPTGLHFTEVEIGGWEECLFSTVRLAEACAETLVRLSYTIDFHRKSNHFSCSWRAEY